MEDANVSPSTERRLSTVARHLSAHSPTMASDNPSSALSPSATAGSYGGAASVFSGIVLAPEDSILGVTVAYNKDPNPVKVNLGVGAYRTEEGKPLVLDVVRKAEQLLVNDPYELFLWQ